MKINALNTTLYDMPIKVFLEEIQIKIFIDLMSKKVYFHENNSIKPFNELPQILTDKLLNKLLKDTTSLRKLKGLPANQILEKFAFYHFATPYGISLD